MVEKSNIMVAQNLILLTHIYPLEKQFILSHLQELEYFVYAL